MSYADDIREFHEAANQPARRFPQSIPLHELALRNELIREEAAEVLDALEQPDIAHVAKELVDLVVVAIGTALHYGIDFDAAWAEVHRSNMSKIPDCPSCRPKGRFAEGLAVVECQVCSGSRKAPPERRPDGKILKGPDYKPPNMRKALGLDG